jgi:hypothetical protein
VTDHTPHGLGRLHKPDERDRKHLLPRPRRLSTRTFRSWLVPGPVLDQGATSQCVGYAGAKWLTALPVVNLHVDPAHLYREAQDRDEWPGAEPDYEGTSVRGLMKAFKDRGLVGAYNWAFDIETLVHHLLETGPMVLGTSWHWNMFDPDSSGYLRLGGGNAGGHAYLAVAVNRNRINPDRSDGGSIRILNSWGESWGQKGRAWITMADMATLLEDDGEAAMGVEIRVRS